MAARTPEVVRQEIETERERLEGAVHTLRRDAKRKLPLVAGAIAAVAVGAALLKRRVSGHTQPETRGRARFPFRR